MIQYKDFNTGGELLIEQINKFIDNPYIKVINIESIFLDNVSFTRVWYYDYK